MTHDQIQWLLYGFCGGVFVCGVISDIIALCGWLKTFQRN